MNEFPPLQKKLVACLSSWKINSLPVQMCKLFPPSVPNMRSQKVRNSCSHSDHFNELVMVVCKVHENVPTPLRRHYLAFKTAINCFQEHCCQNRALQSFGSRTGIRYPVSIRARWETRTGIRSSAQTCRCPQVHYNVFLLAVLVFPAWGTRDANGKLGVFCIKITQWSREVYFGELLIWSQCLSFCCKIAARRHCLRTSRCPIFGGECDLIS